jgi:septum formation protein
MTSDSKHAAPKLVLASGSPRRRELLAEAGYRFEVIAPPEDVECGVCSETGPAGFVVELALRKAQSVARHLESDPAHHDRIILAADTVAECDGFILGKPRDEEDARAMLSRLSGREHRVYSGVCLWRMGADAARTRVAVTRLRMDDLSNEELDAYLESGQWEGKAGAFGYQDRLGWVHVIDGSETNVVGLPMETVTEMLTAAGYGASAARG